MGNTNSDNPSDNEWDDRGELVWNEFDWERYLRQQDETVLRYLAFYEQLRDKSERLDEAATAAWFYMIVRESLRMYDHKAAFAIYRVPTRVIARVGVIKPQR